MSNHLEKDKIPVVGGFKVYSGKLLMETEPEPLEWLVKGLIPKGAKTILAGTTGSNKSFWCLQLALSLASGKDKFLGYSIPEPARVLYLNTEGSRDSVHRRVRWICDTLDISDLDLFKLTGERTRYDDLWTTSSIRKLLEKYEPELLIIDNAYSSTTKDVSKNDVVREFTSRLDQLKENFGLTLLLVCHFNKGTYDQGLILDRTSGASALINWLECGILLSKSRHPDYPDLRLMKLAKMRDEQDNSDIWGLEWDVEKKVLHKIGIIKDEKAHLSSLQKAGFRYDALKMMNEEFETSDWVKVVVEAENEPRIVSRATAHNWLNRLVQDGFIEKTHQGVYRKKGLTVI
jgi:KaiC/GvpD/RAD55 family RecA-like ATPase